MLRGETVQVKTFEVTGFDRFNAPQTSEVVETVDNVLVAPGSTQDLGEDRPLGVEVKYTLYFPKTYGKTLENAEICVRGEWLKTIGFSDVYDPSFCPTDWNMTVEVGEAHG